MEIPQSCSLCPRQCGADRTTVPGACGAGTLKVARAALHHWEEPCISGSRGSGTVFFSHCTLRCGYCQNYPISAGGLGKEISPERLTEIFLELQDQGAHNLNLVSPTQYLPWIIPALEAARARGLSLPVVYNTGGYERVETVRLLAPYVDIWLADLKYAHDSLGQRLSGVPDYFTVASTAIQQMILQCPQPRYDGEGILQKGVILRHLVLPGQTGDSQKVLDWMASLPKGSFLPSIMSQFTPFHRAGELGLGRRITSYEYKKVLDHALALGLEEGFCQDKSSAREEYTPPFDLEGV